MTLPTHWEPGRFYEDDSPHYQHEYLDAELRIRRDDVDVGHEEGEEDAQGVYRLSLLHGMPSGAGDVDIDPEGGLSSLQDAREFAEEVMRALDGHFDVENHYFVGAAMNHVLDTTEYVASGTLDSVDDPEACPICDIPLALFRGNIRESLENHLEYAEDEQHADVTLTFEDTPPEEVEETESADRTNPCQLCGGDVRYRHAVSTEPGLPSGVRDVLRICGPCRDAIDAVEGTDCAWCGATSASTVTVVDDSVAQHNIGYLCRDCYSA